MSRRVLVLAHLLAVAAALSASPASADRECFHAAGCRDSDRMPHVVEPPAAPPAAEPVAAEPAASAPVAPPEAATPAVAERAPAPSTSPPPPVAAPLRPLPQMVVDPTPRYSVDAAPRPMMRTEPARHEPPARHAPAPRDPVREAFTPHEPASRAPVATGYVEEARTASQAPVYATGEAAITVNQGPLITGYSGPAIVVLQGPVHYDDGMAVPVAKHDPAWKLCQLDTAGRRKGANCGPYSYHPYGPYGYRPLGTYRAAHGGARVIYTAPSARVIEFDADAAASIK